MKKATLKTYLITLLVLLLSVTLMLTAFACGNKQEEPEEETKEEITFTSLISNGDFSAYSDGTQPYSPSNWETYTPSGYSAENKVAGVVDTGADYDKNKSAWGDLANPFGSVTENTVLMIYNKELNVFGYTNTFTTTAYGFYKISVKVKVVNAEGGGATIRVYSNNGYTQFSDIDNTDDFKTYTFYLEAPSVDSDSTKVTVHLSLGYQTSKVKGYAFFDDVIVEKIKAEDYKAAEANDTTKKVSMLYPDGEFDYFNATDSTTTLQTPSAWSWKTGSSVGGTSLPTSDRYTGIISTDEESWATNQTDYGTNPGLPVESSDKNVLMITKKKTSNEYSPTAGYYYSKSKIRIDRSTLYEVSVWVKTNVEGATDESNVDNKGARVVLDGTDKLESAVINTTQKTDVNGGWAKVTFYVLGNQYRAQDFTVQLWLGNDKSNDTLTQGTVFFDKLSIAAVNTQGMTREQIVSEYEAKAGSFESAYVSYVQFEDLGTKAENFIFEDNFTSIDDSKYDLAPADESVKVKEGDVIAKIIPSADLDAETWTDEMKAAYGVDTNPLYPYSFSSVLIVNNVIPCSYSLTQKDYFEIKQSLSYRISVWIKTMDLDEGKNVTLKLQDKEGEDVLSFTVNTGDYTNEITNDYAEYSFYLTGDMPVLSASDENTNYVRLVISNGSGTTFEPSSYQKGAFIIANINVEKITYTEYTNASEGTYVKKKDYVSNSATVTNGNFNSYNRDKTTFDDNGFVAMTDKDGNDHLTGAIGSGDWTNNVDERYGTTKKDAEKTATTNFDLNKAADNTENTYDLDLADKTITTIRVTGPENYDKTFNTSSEWEKLFQIDTITGKLKWKNTSAVTDLKDGTYHITVKTDEKVLNNLIAGIINVNAPTAYLDQFDHLTADAIYDHWSTTKDLIDETKAKLVSFGAPNLLMITTLSDRNDGKITLKNSVVDGKATNDMTKTAAIKSAGFTLEGSSYYLLKCYAKAINGAVGEVYVTTSSTDAKTSYYTVEDTDGWVEYNFLIQTGLSSVSAQFEIYFGKKGDGETEFTGTLFFDSFTYVSMTEEEYNAATDPESDSVYKDSEHTKFTTITFDNSSALEKAVSPSGFSASNGSSNNASSNTDSDKIVSGIIAKNNYEFVTSGGKNNLGIYTTKTNVAEDGTETTEDVLEEGSSLERSYIFDESAMDGDATIGDYLLMINNKKETYQSYYLSSLSLASESYYCFSAYVRTAKIKKDSYAKVYVSISDEPISFEVNTEFDENGNDIENKWKKLSFYFKNTKSTSSSASLYFQLGENTDDGNLQGYLFIDNVSLSKISEDEYNTATADYEVYADEEKTVLSDASKTFRLSNKVTVLKDDETSDEDKPDEEEEKPKTSLNTTLLWTYITSIAIAVVLIAVIVVWLVKKYRKPKTTAADTQKADYDRTNVKSDKQDETQTSTGSARDEFKE